jgi:hypothetical protein
MLHYSQLRAKTGISLGALLVGVSLFSVTASAQIRRGINGRGVPSGSAVIFADPNFQGASRMVRSTADLRPYGLNDKVSSIEIPQGEAWEVCQDVNFQSICQTLTSSVPDLRTIGWDDRISSLRRVDGSFRNSDNRNNGYGNPGYGGIFSGRQASPGLVFYDGTGFRGTQTVVTNDAYNQASSLGNRRARSVEVRSGTWQLCDRTGRCTTINQSVSDLSRIGLNGQITSVRAVNNGQGYDPRYDPRDRQYDPRYDPRDRQYDPRYDPQNENNKR